MTADRQTGTKVAVFSSDLPQPTLAAIEEALRIGGCEPVEQFSDIDEVVRFDCAQPGCPHAVDPRITGTSLILLDQAVAGLSGFEVLGVLRAIPETRDAKVIMLGPHGREDWPNDHRTVMAAWGANVDCYLTRRDFLNLEQAELARLACYTRELIGADGAGVGA